MTSSWACPCLEGTFAAADFDRRDVGEDDSYGEVSVLTCRRCRATWLRHFHEVEGISRSGRWHCGRVEPSVAATIAAGNALATIQSLPTYFVGGSALDGVVSRIDSQSFPVAGEWIVAPKSGTVADLKDAIVARFPRANRAHLELTLEGVRLSDRTRLDTLVLAADQFLLVADYSDRCSHGSPVDPIHGGYQCGNC